MIQLRYQLGRTLKRLRKEHQITQTELAEKLYVSTKSISNWECAERGIPLETLADVLYKLGNTPLTIHNQQITIGGVTMSQVPASIQLEVNQFYGKMKEQFNFQRQMANEEFPVTMQLLASKGFQVDFLGEAGDYFTWADQQPWETEVDIQLPQMMYKGYQIKLIAFTRDSVQAEYFDWFGFLSTLITQSDEATAKDIERLLLQEIVRNQSGGRVRNLLRYANLSELFRYCPLLKAYEDLLLIVLDSPERFMKRFDIREDEMAYLEARTYRYWILRQLDFVEDDYYPFWALGWQIDDVLTADSSLDLEDEMELQEDLMCLLEGIPNYYELNLPRIYELIDKGFFD